MKIDREGYAIISIVVVVSAVISAVGFMFLPKVVAIVLCAILSLFVLFVLRFFRVPKRAHLVNHSRVYSPADGTVVVNERVYEEEYLCEQCIQISVFMSVWNVHANWYPVAGKIEYFRHHHGEFMVAWHPKSSTENERTTTVITMENGQKVMFRQIAGLIAKRIVSYAEEGTVVEQNSRCGFIKFGSRLDVFLPLDAKVNVRLGDKVTGSQTILAEFAKK